MKNKGIIFSLVVLVYACDSEPKKPTPPEWNSEKSVRLNQELATEQELDIRVYLSQNEKWKVEETGSGLRYIRLKSTDGEAVQPGMEAKVEYSVSLLDGTKCYETPSDEYDVFKVDNSDVESGIHEGIKLMRVGEKMKLVFPSHLAHGLVGDMDKVPPLSPLVVDIELIAVEK